jgi:hypothetical protein
MRLVRVVFAIAALACSGDHPPADTPAEDTARAAVQPAPVAPPDTVNNDTTAAPAPAIEMGPPMLTAVRTAVHDGTDRIVFEFNGFPGCKTRNGARWH